MNFNAENYAGTELDAMANAPNYQRWIAGEFRPFICGRVLEIGAGIGAMARHWLPLATHLHLVEPAPNLLESLKSNFSGESRVSIHGVTLDRFAQGFCDESELKFDTIILVNVLEHIADDVGALQIARGLLREGGYLLVFAPALPALFGALDYAFGHYRRYTRRSLSRVLEVSGFAEVRIRYFDFFGVLPWLIASRVARAETISPSSVLAFDRFVVPLGVLLESVVRPLIGKNLLSIARRDAA